MPPRTRQRRHGVVRLAALALVILAGTGMLWAVNRQASESESQSLRVGINPWPGYEFAFLAEELGYFESEGIDVRLVEFQSLADSRQAFERGQLDGFFGTLQEFQAVERRGLRDVSIEWVCDASEGGDVVISQGDFKSISELRGERVAYEPGTVTEYLLIRALAKNGMSFADIIPVPAVQSHFEELFRDRSVAAVVTYPPVSIELLTECDSNLLFSSRDIPGEILDVGVFDAAVSQSRSSEVIRFFRAFDRAIEYYEQNPGPAVSVLANRTGASTTQLAAILKNEIHLYRASDQPGMKDAKYLVPLLERYRGLSSPPGRSIPIVTNASLERGATP